MKTNLKHLWWLLLWLSLPVAADAAMLDWSEWDSSWSAGSLGPQMLLTSDGDTITYTGSTTGATSFLSGTPDVLTDNPPSFAFNGTGGAADHYLDLYQDGNVPGDGSIHTFSFDSPVGDLTLEIWDIDANDVNDNYVDLVRITATLVSSAVVAPTSSTITNASVVQMVSADTWSGIPFVQSDDNTNNGNLSVTFGQFGITSVTIEYLNSTDSTTPGVASGGHAIGVYNFSFVPEPHGWGLDLLIVALLTARRLGFSRRLGLQ